MLEALERSQLQSPDVIGMIESTSWGFAVNCKTKQLPEHAWPSASTGSELCDDGMRLALKIRVPCSQAGVRMSNMMCLSRFVPLSIKRRGVETRIVLAAGDEPPRTVGAALLKAVARARTWFDQRRRARCARSSRSRAGKALPGATPSASRAWPSWRRPLWKESARGSNRPI